MPSPFTEKKKTCTKSIKNNLLDLIYLLELHKLLLYIV